MEEKKEEKTKYLVEMPVTLKRIYGYRNLDDEQWMREARGHLPEIQRSLDAWLREVLRKAETLPEHPTRGWEKTASGEDRQRLVEELWTAYFPAWRSWQAAWCLLGSWAQLTEAKPLPGERAAAPQWALSGPYRALPGYKRLLRLKAWLKRRNSSGVVLPDKYRKAKQARKVA